MDDIDAGRHSSSDYVDLLASQMDEFAATVRSLGSRQEMKTEAGSAAEREDKAVAGSASPTFDGDAFKALPAREQVYRLTRVANQLQAVLADTNAVCRQIRQSKTTGGLDMKTVVDYAFRIAGTTCAPPGWDEQYMYNPPNKTPYVTAEGPDGQPVVANNAFPTHPYCYPTDEWVRESCLFNHMQLRAVPPTVTVTKAEGEPMTVVVHLATPTEGAQIYYQIDPTIDDASAAQGPGPDNAAPYDPNMPPRVSGAGRHFLRAQAFRLGSAKGSGYVQQQVDIEDETSAASVQQQQQPQQQRTSCRPVRWPLPAAAAGAAAPPRCSSGRTRSAAQPTRTRSSARTLSSCDDDTTLAAGGGGPDRRTHLCRRGPARTASPR
mmetsp:Transcript_14475/g.34542  ORF Transcript_14475/g.34542 Transcript_14475/m.34542 type:complete len:378 (-) Transcript_14475:1601-2734(-)